jgi:hypothetical protein
MGSRSAAGFPSTRTTPAEGSIIRLKVRSRVVFPEPLSPTSATVSPGRMASVTPARAAVPSP